VLLTRSPLVYPRRGLTARLACVKHAASVRPEPGSNSPLKSICQPQPKGRGQQTNKKRSFESETKSTDFESRNNFKGIRHRTTDNPPPKVEDQGLKSHPMPVYGDKTNFGIDFRHAVEFSRIGRTPRFRLSFEAPGQLAQLYCFVRGRSNRPLSSQSPCATQ
jgi:hypothetical protein